MEQEVIEQRLKKNGAGWLGYVFLFLLITIAVGTAQKDRGETMEGGDVTYVESAPKPQEQNMVTCTACRGNGRCCSCNGSGSGDTDFFCGFCGGNGVCDYCEGEGRYPENMDFVADAFNYVTKKGLCNMCRATGRCFFCGGVERPAWLGPCFACCGTNVCALCQGKKYVDVMDKGVKARE